MNLFKVIKFDLTNSLKNPSFLIAYIFFPSMILPGLGYLTKDNYGAYKFSSIDFYGITMGIFLCLFISQLVSNSFTDELIKAVNIRVIYSPTYKAYIYLSKIISAFAFGSILFSIFALFESYILKVNFGGNKSPYVFFIMILFLFFMCTLGAFICCIIPNGDAANKVITLICFLFAGLGGAFMPLGHFGKSLNIISSLSPVKIVSKCAFAIIYDSDFSMIIPTSTLLIILSIILIILCQITFKPEEYI